MGNGPRIRAGEITDIPAEEIWQHPDNPRKDLGDLTELTESIRKGGVMQNLTVTPGHWDGNREWHRDGYTLLIGHRRHAAAKAAGLASLPCLVREGLDRKEQIAVMLEENMQRADLSVWEQAASFQMVLDLGGTEEQLAEKTGFSRGTIRHRLNIARLDLEELKKKEQDESFQLTLRDLYELEKIKDGKTRDRVLRESTDSRNLAYRAREAVREEKREAHRKEFAELFKEAGIKKAPKNAERERWDGKWDILQKWELDGGAPETLGEFKEDARWVEFWDRTMAVISPAQKKEKKLTAQEKKQAETDKARKGLEQRQRALYGKIGDFILDITTGRVAPIKEDTELYRALMGALMEIGASFSERRLAKLHSGKELYEIKSSAEELGRYSEWKAGLSTLEMAAAHLCCVDYLDICDHQAKYREDSAGKVRAAVNFLERYGFSLEKEEEQLLDGTHSLYKGQEGEAKR